MVLYLLALEAETVLHEAVRLEGKDVVGVLLSADSQLARVMGRMVNKEQTPRLGSKPNEGIQLLPPELLIAAAHGDFDEIKRLLLLHGEEDAARQPVEVVLDVTIEDTVADVKKPAVNAVRLSEAVTGAGDSVLHVVASSGDGGEFLESATVIVGKANHLLGAFNRKRDTPLHCAARLRNARMVSHLLALARAGDGTSDDERVKAILTMKNDKGETVLHEAIRLEDKEMIGVLLSADSQLARVPLTDGASPLYLALSLGRRDIAQLLFEKDKELSYSGPDGQNALHAAIRWKWGQEATPKTFLRTMGVKVLTLFHLKSHLQKYRLGKQSGNEITEQSKDEIIEMLLEMNKDLIKQADRSTGRTPLHYAALFGETSVAKLLLSVDPSPLYLPDSNGSFPIHVAASNGQPDNVMALLQKKKEENISPYCAQLRDGKGRTFLHVAVQDKRLEVVKYACQEKISSVINMQDDQGNTALHLAVEVGDIRIVRALVSIPEVKLNLTNKEEETPRELAFRYRQKGTHSRYSNPRSRIYWLLHDAAHLTASPQENILPAREIHNNEEDTSQIIVQRTQIIGLGSVLITTVTFAAAFAVPGGYRTDGTPTLAGQYAFDAFVMANTLAFVYSGLSIILLMFAGLGDESGRRIFSLLRSINFLAWSARSLGAAFAFGMYAVLAPVQHKNAIGYCFFTIGMLVLVETEWGFRAVKMVYNDKVVLVKRFGISRAWWRLALAVLWSLMFEFTPYFPYIISALSGRGWQ